MAPWQQLLKLLQRLGFLHLSLNFWRGQLWGLDAWGGQGWRGSAKPSPKVRLQRHEPRDLAQWGVGSPKTSVLGAAFTDAGVLVPSCVRPHPLFFSLPAVQAGSAEAPHQNAGHPLPPQPAHHGRVRRAWPPRLETSRCHHPLPSPSPRTSPVPNTACPRPHHTGPHRLRSLLEPLGRPGSVGCATGAAQGSVPGQAALLLANGKP